MADTHSDPAQPKPSHADDIAAMAAVLTAQYGADAVLVAQRQIDARPEDGGAAIWREILAHLPSD